MSDRLKIREEIKVWVYYQILGMSEIASGVTHEDVNSVLVDILHDNSKHNSKESYKNNKP